MELMLIFTTYNKNKIIEIMADWFDKLDEHPANESERELECACCGVPINSGTYCSRGCKKEDNN
tara:strand:- start:8222 stop:8413 length:192 start_codon:yes stop_codon:yes gene_type:complete